MKIDSLSWYVARSSGLIGWALLSASVIWGLLLSTRASAAGRRPRPAWTLDLHRYLGGLATVFTAVHVAGIVADSYVHFTLWSVLVPFASQWRRGAVAWGVVALYLLVAVELTSLFRSRLPRKAWRAVHAAAFPLFVFATVHGYSAGTDTHSRLVVLVATATTLAIAGLTGLRIRQASGQSEPPGLTPPAGGAASTRPLARCG